MCTAADCSDGQLRLTGGVDDRSGCVEICYNQRWKTLFPGILYWFTYNARVACNELGFNSKNVQNRNIVIYIGYISTGYSVWRRLYSYVKTNRLYKYFNCTGSEQRLSLCPSGVLPPRNFNSVSREVGINGYIKMFNGSNVYSIHSYMSQWGSEIDRWRERK